MKLNIKQIPAGDEPQKGVRGARLLLLLLLLMMRPPNALLYSFYTRLHHTTHVSGKGESVMKIVHTYMCNLHTNHLPTTQTHTPAQTQMICTL